MERDFGLYHRHFAASNTTYTSTLSRFRSNQGGQASVFVLAFLGIVVLALVFLYKSGRLTSEKMQLQNGADSAAYSASMLEARAMNFAAYTNRAMVANEVAIGQMVGMLSWAAEVTAIGETLEVVGDVLDATGYFAEVGVALDAVGGGFIDAGETMTEFLDTVTPVLIRGLSTINEIYSVSQEVYYLTTVLLATNAIFQSLEDNVPGTPHGNALERIVSPGKKGARLSPLGLIALAGHAPSHISGFSRRYALKPSDNDKATLAGMGRLAATIREGRDDFTSGGRGWALKGYASLDLLLAKAKLSFGLESKGGSEIRYKDNAYVWSAVDTAAWVNKITVHTRWPKHTFHIPLPGAPLGGGSSQANNGQQMLTIADMPLSLGRYGSPPAYGGAPDHPVSWEEAGAEIAENMVPDDPYPNLRAYRDVVPGKEKGSLLFPFVSPFFLIGVVRPMEDIEGDGPQFSAPFDLSRAKELDGNLGAIAKSEVYLSRPNDLEQFKRVHDHYKEKDNLFSPFWQARLVKTSDLDRFLSLAFQQKIIWLNDQDAAEVPGADKVVKWLHRLLEALL